MTFNKSKLLHNFLNIKSWKASLALFERSDPQLSNGAKLALQLLILRKLWSNFDFALRTIISGRRVYRPIRNYYLHSGWEKSHFGDCYHPPHWVFQPCFSYLSRQIKKSWRYRLKAKILSFQTVLLSLSNSYPMLRNVWFEKFVSFQFLKITKKLSTLIFAKIPSHSTLRFCGFFSHTDCKIP